MGTCNCPDHHERWDARGYPDKLGSATIPLFARVLAVADAFDAMSSSRCYRRALDRGKIVDEMARCRETQFDPELALLLTRTDLTEYEHMLQTSEMPIPVAA